jgi:cell division protein WhiA
MSFSTNIKNEITKLDVTKDEAIAELSSYIRNNSNYDKEKIQVVTENASIARRVFKLIKDIYNITCVITVRKTNVSKHNLYILTIKDKVFMVLNDLSIMDNDNKQLDKPDNYIISDEEEKRAYLRGLFLATGSVNDPKTARYHLEFSIDNKNHASFVNNLLNEYSLNSKVLKRPKGYMVYIKEAEKIGDFLRIINAYNAVLYYEDIRIYRDHKNMTNRLNNCEQANVDKIINTANAQIEDIKILSENVGLDLLDDKTKEVVTYRLKYPESSLIELSEIISIETNNNITKSGLNHRFRKIREIANRIRKIKKD